MGGRFSYEDAKDSLALDLMGVSLRASAKRDADGGWGFRGDPDLGSFSILRNMRATIRPKEETDEGEGADEPGTAN